MTIDLGEKVDWLEVVMDYGKRFPNTKIEDFGLNFTKEMLERKICNLKYSWVSYLKYDGLGFNTFTIRSKVLNFYNVECIWEPVPQHILLRLLTEGKEDLI